MNDSINEYCEDYKNADDIERGMYVQPGPEIGSISDA